MSWIRQVRLQRVTSLYRKPFPAAISPQDELLSLAAGCEQSSTHPIAVSIVEAARVKNLRLSKPASLEEIAGHGIKSSH